MKNHPEMEFVRIWQHQWLAQESLVTEDGQAVEVIHPGRFNDEEGPDFRDAIIVIGRELSRGDIEVHLKADDWQEHGHHRDANYNRVILHVVRQHSARVTTKEPEKNAFTLRQLVFKKS